MSQCMLCASSQSAVQIICVWLSVTVLVDEAPVFFFCFSAAGSVLESAAAVLLQDLAQ